MVYEGLKLLALHVNPVIAIEPIDLCASHPDSHLYISSIKYAILRAITSYSYRNWMIASNPKHFKPLVSNDQESRLLNMLKSERFCSMSAWIVKECLEGPNASSSHVKVI